MSVPQHYFSGGGQTQYAASNGGLATAAFTHQSQSLMLIDLKTDPIHGFDIADFTTQQASGNGKIHFKIFHFNNGFRARGFHFFSCISA
jgi:hypothetical protein